ncbi:MAG: Metallophosphoesterase, partial [Deltaproteobacteria bacterium]|nr:Metallophosphoesterase [Deltaproteobacteria bacterium]
ERAARTGVGLMFCGHTHAGQIWPFGYLVRLFYPLLEERYEVDGMTAIVCRGTGTGVRACAFGVPARFCA